jgi:uncharacterized YccA/Bax inhibitor family protein
MHYAGSMRGPAWWHSFARMDALFRGARTVAIAAFTIGAASWIGEVPIAAVLGVIGGTTAVLVMLFAWFRSDDLGRAPGGRS